MEPLARTRASGAIGNLSGASRPLSGRVDRYNSGFFIKHKRELTTLPVLRYSSGHRKGRLKILYSLHRARMASLLDTIRDFLKDHLTGNLAAGDPPAPGKLADIATIVNKLTNIQLSTGNNGLADWLDELD